MARKNNSKATSAAVPEAAEESVTAKAAPEKITPRVSADAGPAKATLNVGRKSTGAASSAPGSGKTGSSKALSICSRLVDLLFVKWYLVFLFTVTFTDIHNFMASMRGITVQELVQLNDMQYPPKFLTQLYKDWAESVDPLLLENPPFWQVMEWVNLLCLMPFSLVAIAGFWKGWNCIRLPAVITNSFTFYSLLICIFSTYFSPLRPEHWDIFLFVYVPYLIFPALLVWRLWDERPFSKPMGTFKTMAIFVIATVTYALFYAYSIKWFRIHRADQLPESIALYLFKFEHAVIHTVQSAVAFLSSALTA